MLYFLYKLYIKINSEKLKKILDLKIFFYFIHFIFIYLLENIVFKLKNL